MPVFRSGIVGVDEPAAALRHHPLQHFLVPVYDSSKYSFRAHPNVPGTTLSRRPLEQFQMPIGGSTRTRLMVPLAAPHVHPCNMTISPPLEALAHVSESKRQFSDRAP